MATSDNLETVMKNVIEQLFEEMDRVWFIDDNTWLLLPEDYQDE